MEHVPTCSPKLWPSLPHCGFPGPAFPWGQCFTSAQTLSQNPILLALTFVQGLDSLLCSRRPAGDPCVHITALTFAILLRTGRLGKGAHYSYSTLPSSREKSFPLQALVTDFNFWQYCNLGLFAWCLLLRLKPTSFPVFPVFIEKGKTSLSSSQFPIFILVVFFLLVFIGTLISYPFYKYFSHILTQLPP